MPPLCLIAKPETKSKDKKGKTDKKSKKGKGTKRSKGSKTSEETKNSSSSKKSDGSKKSKGGGKSKRSKKSGDSKKSKSKKSSSKKTDRKIHSSQPQLLPIEIIYQHYYMEEYITTYEIQITTIYREPCESLNLIYDSIGSEIFMTRMRQLLFPAIILHYKDDAIVQDLMSVMPIETQKDSKICQIIDLTPWQGMLEPFESQAMNIAMHGIHNMAIRARALCHIEGGPTEFLDIFGTTGDIYYTLEKTFVNFYRQVSFNAYSYLHIYTDHHKCDGR